jgi:hypothetical protein
VSPGQANLLRGDTLQVCYGFDIEDDAHGFSRLEKVTLNDKISVDFSEELFENHNFGERD